MFRVLVFQVKELESQLLVERKLARQHVDTKIAEQHMRQHQQQDELSRPPLASKPLNTPRIFEESKQNQSNIIQQPLVENNTFKLPAPLPPARDLVNLDDYMEKEHEKENNPCLPERFTIPKRTGRASICTTSQRLPVRSVVPRRNSLIPLPTSTAPVSTKFVPPLPSIEADNENVDGPEFCIMEPLATDSPKRSNGGEKKLMNALRRSVQKKNQMKSPMQLQQIRRVGGLNVAVERVRVSIGSRGRMAHRVLANGRRLKQQNCMEKERRWNIGK